MVGADYHSHEQQPDDGSPQNSDSVLRLSVHQDADAPAPEPAEEETHPDQIVQIDFSPSKSTPDEHSPETIKFLHLEHALLSEDDEVRLFPEVKIPPTMSSVAVSLPVAPPSNVPHLSASSSIIQTIDDLTQVAQESQRQFGWIRTEMGKYATIIPKIETLQKQVEHSNKLETANQKLFDTMHEELKSYKDSFLFETLQKPVIRDMLLIFDDLCGQARRMARFLSENPADRNDVTAVVAENELRTARENVNNTVHFLIEIFNRLDVVLEEGQHEKLDIKLHKVVGIEPTELPDEQNSIARVVRPGFYWRDRLLRPTEVIVRKLPQSIRKSGKK